jgi:Tol biopolymer transport system component/predicted Ser/Thr protein kinase
MTFAAGTRLGVYEITGLIGVGGMGEVYRATDTTLGREVAIKTLPREFARDADRLARFQREAQLLAALNHSHIAAIYGLHEHEGTRFLAMELVDGETLDKKSRASLTVEQALRLALQIAEALEAAHEKGVVHRDLKPANIMVTRDGQVKVLDFGLAKAFVGDPTATIPAHSPALSLAMTQQGFVLGTAAYMSPEQASGQATDQRADIWAFGVVLFELLAGSPLFGGESVPHILADVLRSEPDWTRLPKNLHPRLRLLLERCLEKNARNRYHSIADVRVDIEKVLSDPLGLAARPEIGAAAPRRSLVSRFGIGLALASLGALIAGGAAWRLRPARDVQVTRFSVDLAGPLDIFGSAALSPDGRRIVYGSNGQLYSQRLDQDEATSIPGTEQAGSPFFAPDGESVAFFTQSQLKAARFAGEAPRVLANVDGLGTIGTWDEQGRILFGRSGPFGLSWVQARGGVPEPFAELGDYKDIDYPDVLPGGEWVLFTADVTQGDWSSSDIVVQNASTGERKVVLKGGTFARYLRTGHLVFARRGALYAVAFDAKRLEAIGREVPVVQDVATEETGGVAQYGVSSNGTLIYAQRATPTGSDRLAVVQASREGVTTALSTELRGYAMPRVSPDGLRLAVEVGEGSSRAQIWIMDLATGNATQLTFDGENHFPVWTHDGREVLFTSKRDGKFAIYRQPADCAGEAVRVLEGTDRLVATDVLKDNVLLYQDTGAGGTLDILTFDLEHPGSPAPFLATAANEFGARASPDGAWVAYVSWTPTGGDLPKVYVRPYSSKGGGQRAVSEAAGVAPVWSRNGDRIFYVGPPPGHMMSVAVQTTATTITPGRPEQLFEAGKLQFESRGLLSSAPYDVAPNGDGFVASQQPGAASTADASAAARPKVRVVLNWLEELQRLVPTK